MYVGCYHSKILSDAIGAYLLPKVNCLYSNPPILCTGRMIRFQIMLYFLSFRIYNSVKYLLFAISFLLLFIDLLTGIKTVDSAVHKW